MERKYIKTYTLRLHPSQDLKKELIKFAQEKKIQAGFILTCVGSLSRATLRMADEKITKDFEMRFEINSLVGTLSPDGVHLHLSLSDETGASIGGHVKEGCLINLTAEIIIGELEDTTFSREFDPHTGFKELVVSKK